MNKSCQYTNHYFNKTNLYGFIFNHSECQCGRYKSESEYLLKGIQNEWNEKFKSARNSIDKNQSEES